MVKGKIHIKIVKIEAEVLVKKEPRGCKTRCEK